MHLPGHFSAEKGLVGVDHFVVVVRAPRANLAVQHAFPALEQQLCRWLGVAVGRLDNLL